MGHISQSKKKTNFKCLELLGMRRCAVLGPLETSHRSAFLTIKKLWQIVNYNISRCSSIGDLRCP